MTPEVLEVYHHLDKNPVQYDSILRAFLEDHQDIYSRDNLFGHITASAFILSPDSKSVLLIEHKKYRKWLIPGGHVDPEETPVEAARREAEEEVGIREMTLLSQSILDIDIHRIPSSEKRGEPEHWHFDVRFLFQAHQDRVSLNLEEATDYRWVSLSEAKRLRDRPLTRMISKIPA